MVHWIGPIPDPPKRPATPLALDRKLPLPPRPPPAPQKPRAVECNKCGATCRGNQTSCEYCRTPL